jgi:hypothetical protein
LKSGDVELVRQRLVLDGESKSLVLQSGGSASDCAYRQLGLERDHLHSDRHVPKRFGNVWRINDFYLFHSAKFIIFAMLFVILCANLELFGQSSKLFGGKIDLGGLF